MFVPESTVFKIEHKELKRELEESIATKFAEEMNSPKHEVFDEQKNCFDVTVGSDVQLPNAGSGASMYGIVRWIGAMPDVTGLVAGIELVSSTSRHSLGGKK